MLGLVGRLAGALNMPMLPPDMSIEQAVDALEVRGQQLSCVESSISQADANTQTLVCGLRHKLKRLRDKLSDKVEIYLLTYIRIWSTMDEACFTGLSHKFWDHLFYLGTIKRPV